MKIGMIGTLLVVTWSGLAVSQLRTAELLPSDLELRPFAIDVGAARPGDPIAMT